VTAGADLEELAARLRAGSCPPDVEILKRSPVRTVVRARGAALKVYAAPAGRPAREARALAEARRRGVRVPEVLGRGEDWIATRWLDGRPATPADLPLILEAVEGMHDAGVLHGDLHLGNLLVSGGEVAFTDWQRARFWPRIPGPLRRRELGWLAYSLGDPLPEQLEHVRFWRDRRARRHLASRTKRCRIESSGFTRFERAGARGWRRRDTDPDALGAALDAPERSEPLKSLPRAKLWRRGAWVVKEHARTRDARRAWIHGHGLEVRGIATGRAAAWLGRMVVMEDAGEVLIDWIERDWEKAEPALRFALADALGDLLARLHRAGVYHADLKANNVAWSPGAEPRLLDYGRVRFGRRVGYRRRVKNLAQLNAALPDAVDAPFRERALAHYLERSGFRGDPDRLRGDVVRESLRRRHRWSGC
jgi:tRNA A-37 threonylcarbamoyl transferase component Bud32